MGTFSSKSNPIFYYKKKCKNETDVLEALNLKKTRIIIEARVLSFAFGSLDDNYILSISTALINNTSLTKLDLSGNNIGDIGAKFISNALQSNNVLTGLNLSENYFRENGIK